MHSDPERIADGSSHELGSVIPVGINGLSRFQSVGGAALTYGYSLQPLRGSERSTDRSTDRGTDRGTDRIRLAVKRPFPKWFRGHTGRERTDRFVWNDEGRRPVATYAGGEAIGMRIH